MAELLVASSPIEIEAKADEAGLSSGARAAALTLFHDLTSRLGLAAPTLDHHAEEGDWPRHRLFFGPARGAVGELVAALRGQAEAREVLSDAPQDHAGAHTLFADGVSGDYEAVLVASDTGQRLRALVEPLLR